MFLLDTNVLSELMKSSPEVKVMQWMNGMTAGECFISSVTRAEIELGIALLPDGKRKKSLSRAAKSMFAEFPDRCLSFDGIAASKYAEIVADRTRIGRPVSVEDAQIAAIALAHKMTLATRNSRDFEHIKGLSIVNPWLQDLDLKGKPEKKYTTSHD